MSELLKNEEFNFKYLSSSDLIKWIDNTSSDYRIIDTRTNDFGPQKIVGAIHHPYNNKYQHA